MKLIRRIYEELNIYYNFELITMVARMLMPWFLIIGISGVVYSICWIFNLNFNEEFIPFLMSFIIGMPIIVLICLFAIWYDNVRPLVKRVKHEIELKRKWKPLLDKFNKTN